MPEISVVLPVYNAEKYIGAAICSILEQSFTNFELIIVNDGSTDGTSQVIDRFISDSRVRIINHNNNGLVFSLNKAIAMAKGVYIARMDADDICLLDRLDVQLAYIKRHNLDIVGSWVETFSDSNDNTEVLYYPESHIDNKYTLLFKSSLAHPSVLIKKQLFDKIRYRDGELCEDYDLWCQAILHGFKIGNVPKVLLRYRKHQNQITNIKEKALFESLENVRDNYAKNLDNRIYQLIRLERSLHSSSNLKLLKIVFEDLHNLLSDSGVTDVVQYDILRYVYINITPKNIFTFFEFYKYIRFYNKSLLSERPLFFRSLLFWSRDSFIYKATAKVYRWTR